MNARKRKNALIALHKLEKLETIKKGKMDKMDTIRGKKETLKKQSNIIDWEVPDLWEVPELEWEVPKLEWEVLDLEWN